MDQDLESITWPHIKIPYISSQTLIACESSLTKHFNTHFFITYFHFLDWKDHISIVMFINKSCSNDSHMVTICMWSKFWIDIGCFYLPSQVQALKHLLQCQVLPISENHHLLEKYMKSKTLCGYNLVHKHDSKIICRIA